MTEFLKNLRVVLLSCPYDTWEQPLTKELFTRMVDLKIAGYQREYRYGVLPLDTSDFVANHFLICEENLGKLTPLMGYKSFTLSSSKLFRVTFPPLGLVKSLGSLDYEMAVTKIIERCEKDGIEISYEGSFTILPHVRANPAQSQIMHELFMGLPYLYQKEYGITESLAGGNVRFKMERLCKPMGYEELRLEGKILEPVEWYSAYGEKVRLFHLQKFSDYSRILANKYKSFWQNRIEIKEQKAVKKVA